MYLNATEFSDQGTVTSAKFTPSLIGTYNLASLMEEAPNEKSKNNLLKALDKTRAALVDGYEVLTAPKEYPFDAPIQIWDISAPVGSTVTTVPNSAVMVASNGVFPNTSSDVMVISSKGTMRMAKEGAFVVQQGTNPTNQWNTVPNTSPLQATQPTGLIVSYARILSNGVWTFIPLYTNPNSAQSNTSSPLTAETPWSDRDWVFTLFEGLSNAAPGSANVFPPYITYKGFTGLEIQVEPNSSLLPFQRLLPMPDPTALEIVAGVFHDRPDSLPAAANDLGTIAKTVLTFLPTAVGWLKDLFGNSQQKKQAMVKASNFVQPKRKKNPPPRRPPPTTPTAPRNNKINKQMANIERRLANLQAFNSRPTPMRQFENLPAIPAITGPRRRRNPPNRGIPLRTYLRAPGLLA
jgi:hypothetical protein